MTIDPQGLAITLALVSGFGSAVTASLTRRFAGPGVPSTRGALMHAILACTGIVGIAVAALFHQDTATLIAALSAVGNIGMMLLVAPSADPSQSRLRTETKDQTETQDA